MIKFLVDECTGTNVAKWINEQGFDVFSVFDELRGASDKEILEKCFNEDYILITNDKDFGEMIFRQKEAHKGIIFIRCEPNNFKKRIEVLELLFKNHLSELSLNFVVVTNDKIRIINQI